MTLADTGIDTMTGGRVRRASRYLAPDDREFFLTYGDGVADIDVGALLEFHRASGKPLTISAVHPEGRFGEMKLDGNRVAGFEEKPPRSENFINGGFMVVDRAFLPRYLDGEDCYFEAAPMREAIAAGDLAAFRHEGFWQCMDTPREHRMLNTLWSSGRAPWTKYWRE
ncbi:Glucose-1-phosphate cytidylyltransferase [bioreactor metagenome]|uniref:Glucose-1-phosphate cytidylyltransferase n=1 Tax=bioreactor metagenome TaxID=1076179 RepID=A0A645FHY2_9ZZZZ